MKVSFMSDEHIMLGTDPVILTHKNFEDYMCAKFQIDMWDFIKAKTNEKYYVEGLFVAYYGNSVFMTKSLAEITTYSDECAQMFIDDDAFTLHYFENSEDGLDCGRAYLEERFF